MKNQLLLLSSFFLSFVFFACEDASSKTNSGQENAETEIFQDSVYLARGEEVVRKTFVTLSSHLKAALQEKGVRAAVEYCHLNAYPLVDSLSNAYDAQIRRTSLKVRNPQNAPDEYEQKALAKAAALHEDGKSISPWVEHLPEGEVAYYAPVYTLPLCLKCHGTPGASMAEEDYALIKEYYPEDQATGYQAGDWRGLWSIRFKEK